MASYQILKWSDIPIGVKAKDDDGTVRKELHARFQNAVDAMATATDRVETKAYLAEWTWGESMHRDGTAAEVAATVVTELENSYSTEQMSALRVELIERLGVRDMTEAGVEEQPHSS